MSSDPILATLFPDTATLRDDGVTVGGVGLRELATTFGTPLFVYDEETLRARCREAANAFDDGVAFASKSFLCGAMARLAFEEGLCVDVATGGELDLVLRSGVPAHRVIMHGNNKSRGEPSPCCVRRRDFNFTACTLISAHRSLRWTAFASPWRCWASSRVTTAS